MRRLILLASAVGLTSASALVAPLRAQTTGLSLWAGIGGAHENGVSTFAKDTKQLGAQLSLPLVPLAVRADAMLQGSRLDADHLSYNLNAVAVMPLPLLQPYGILGRGRYALAPGVKEKGWNYGAGVRVGIARLGVFAEMRKHEPLQRTITTVGVTF
ncbi:MAG: hypothetical protein HUU26_12825 [Gemmatimonadaceae bacterium]|nr:hypothetical protein [Gemmatimonadaceae bacterium]